MHIVYKLLKSRCVFLFKHNRMWCSTPTRFRYFASSSLIVQNPVSHSQVSPKWNQRWNDILGYGRKSWIHKNL